VFNNDGSCNFEDLENPVGGFWSPHPPEKPERSIFKPLLPKDCQEQK
jgi:hypothetical protein